jgi:hypothetical protein
MTTDAKVERIGAIYAGFMHEIKLRLVSIESTLGIIADAAAEETAFLYAEFCYLQLRMICELIALAALVAHNELPEANKKKLLKDWNADSIFDRLSAVNEHCYPVPLKTVQLPSGHKHLQRIQEPYLTRADLKDAYHACGSNLHRGILLHVLDGRRRAYDIQPLRERLASIVQLLEQHAVLLPEANAALLVRMSGEGGEVSCSRLVGLHGESFVVGKDDPDPVEDDHPIAADDDIIAETDASTTSRSSPS